MSLWRMIFTNLRRHRVRTAIGAAGIALGVATMLSVVGLLGGAVKMFERILQSDAEMVVFEKNVSDLFFSNVPVEVAEELEQQPFVKEARPVLFTIITAPERPVVTCFGISAADPRLSKGEWLQAARRRISSMARTAWCSASGRRISSTRRPAAPSNSAREPIRWPAWCGWRTVLKTAACSCRWAPASRRSTRKASAR